MDEYLEGISNRSGKIRCRIEEWQTFDYGSHRLSGKVYGHPRYPEGHEVWTTTIIREDDKEIEIINTIYELGVPHE